MFIPTSNTEIKIGDTVILNKDLGVHGGVFTKGHKFKVIDMYDVYGYKNYFVNIIDDEENLLKKININILSKDIKFKEANKIQKKINYKNEVLKCISENCENTTVEYDNRDVYDGCKLKKGYYPMCNVELSCIKYSKVAKEKYPEILRNLKIKKLKK